MNDLVQGPVVITGGGGFLGKALVETFRNSGVEVVAPRKADYDLTSREHVQKLYQKFQPAIVIHAAAHGGGIGYMQRFPAEVYYDNMMMNTMILHEAYIHGVKQFVSIGTVCSYPKYAPVPFVEHDLWNGYPEETNSAYGLAKKMMIVQLEAYRQQYGFQGFQLLFSNLYGPGDNFDLRSSHVIPALIRRFVEAKEHGQSAVTLWGTGEATREFLYVGDAVEAVCSALDRYRGCQPVNVGVGQEISIRRLVGMVQEITGFSGDVVWDQSKPDGQPRRCLDVSIAWKEFGFRAGTGLYEGLRQTVAWYLDHRGLYASAS